MRSCLRQIKIKRTADTVGRHLANTSEALSLIPPRLGAERRGSGILLQKEPNYNHTQNDCGWVYTSSFFTRSNQSSHSYSILMYSCYHLLGHCSIKTKGEAQIKK